MTASLTSPRVAAARTAAPAVVSPEPWLVCPTFDALFVSNVFWPLLAGGLLWWGPESRVGVSFWQIYFVTTPHRWITLALVFLDRDRFHERPRAFLAVGGAVTAAFLAVRLGTGGLTCLFLVDYLWNAWHFASQHSGILRIYSRQARPSDIGSGLVEKALLRTFVLYVLIRVSQLAWPLFGRPLEFVTSSPADTLQPRFSEMLALADWLSPLLPLLLILRVRPRWNRAELGRSLYLASFLSLYLWLLAAAHARRFDAVLVLILVLALFHATEYLALVSWAVHQRHASRRAEPAGARSRPLNPLAAVVPHWGLALAGFCVALGLAGWLSDRRSLEICASLNVAVSFLHYAYDGMIWKRRLPRAAA